VKIEILNEAQEDLIKGFHFYEDRNLNSARIF